MWEAVAAWSHQEEQGGAIAADRLEAHWGPWPRTLGAENRWLAWFGGDCGMPADRSADAIKAYRQEWRNVSAKHAGLKATTDQRRCVDSMGAHRVSAANRQTMAPDKGSAHARAPTMRLARLRKSLHLVTMERLDC